MDDFIEVGKTDEIPDNSMKMYNVEEREILVAKVGDKFYSADNKCPHMGGNLSNGTLEGAVVTCPRHHSQFNVTDGHVIKWTDWTGIKLTASKIFRSPRPLKTHEVKVVGEKILIKLE